MPTFHTRKGEVIESSLTNVAAIGLLGQSTDKFAISLKQQWLNRGRLTDEQWAYVHKIAMAIYTTGVYQRPQKSEYTTPPRPVSVQRPQSSGSISFKPTPSVSLPEEIALPPEAQWLREQLGLGSAVAIMEPPVEAEQVTDGPTMLDPEVFRIFGNATGKLKHPKIRFQIDGLTVVLSLAGERAKFPGTINVTDDGKYPNNRFFGRIHKNGRFEAYPACNETVAEFLNEFSKDPIGAVTLYGQRSGNCCFCKDKLTTDESLKAGYGPVCAKNWGLPWGRPKTPKAPKIKQS